MSVPSCGSSREDHDLVDVIGVVRDSGEERQAPVGKDCIGVYRGSPGNIPHESQPMETTRNFIELLTTNVSTLTNPVIVDTSSTIAQKLLERRSGAVYTGNRLAMQLLPLMADRLEKGGERAAVVPTKDPISGASGRRSCDDGDD